MNVPELRFSEFTEEWERKNLGEIAGFSKGKGISKADISEDGKTECIRYGELYTHYGEVIDEIKSRTNVSVHNLVLSEANDVIIPASGETQIDIATASCILKTGIGLGGDLNIIKTKNNGVFLSYYLNNRKKIDIANLAQGISVVHLYSSQLASLNLNIPTLIEQTRIATFLTSVDEKLTQLKKKKTLLEQYKKGVMQKIFSQELRFKDEIGKYFPEWKQITLGDVAERIGDGLHGTPTYTENTGFYFINGNNLTNGSIVINETTKEVDLETYKKNRKGLNDNTLLISLNGTIGNVARYKNEKVMLGKSAGYFNFKENTNFYFYLLNTANVQNYFKSEVTGSTIKNLSLKTLRETKLLLPSLAEQTKIANFLSSLDDKINHCQKQIEKTELWKKGLMQKMFV